MDQNVNVCNYCGIRVDNYRKEPGWIRFKAGELRVIFVKGIEKNGYPIIEWEDFQNKSLDFCCRKCLNAWLDKLEFDEKKED